MKLLKLSTLIALFSLTPDFAQARGPQSEGGERQHHRRGKGFMKKLDLSEEQRSKVKEIRQAGKAKRQELRAKVNEAQEAFQAAQKSDASRSEILSKFDELSALKAQMGRLRIEGMLDIREILTPEQRAKAQSALEKRREKRGEKRKGRRHSRHDSDENNEDEGDDW